MASRSSKISKKDEGKTHKKKISVTSDSVEKFSEPKPKTNFVNKAIGFVGRITGAAKTSSKLTRHSSVTSVNVESESTTAGDEDEEFYSANEDDVEGSKQAAKGTSSTSMTRNSACRRLKQTQEIYFEKEQRAARKSTGETFFVF